ncbi:MAG TPA: tryptophan--tRNA ligase [Bacilli bacterium]|nr:tryptophan--tRNA ligase [Bacilli bacterium]
MKEVILTGERPTGPLHIGHYAGALKKRVELQNTNKYDIYILIADLQALTDNFSNPKKIRDNILEVVIDNLAVGIDPSKVTFVLQSQIPALLELPILYSNLVTQARLERNPTVKQEMILRGFSKSIPVGFVNYPISQAADITAFKATTIPVGEDQLPMIEQTREIVETFNRIYKTDTLVLPKAVLPDNLVCKRIPGTDGNAKMGKSLGNCIYLKDSEEEVRKKIMGMYTDPNHIRVDDPGNVTNNTVFKYLEAFCCDEDFEKYLPEYKNLDELKAHYERGGVGDVLIKKFLNNIMQELLTPIRERRKYYEEHKEEVYQMLLKDTEKAIEVTNKTLNEVKSAIGINYFNDNEFYDNYIKKES